jgi:hypothetical protein
LWRVTLLNAVSCDFQVDYLNWSVRKTRVGKREWQDVQAPVFEVPKREVILTEIAKCDHITGKRTKEQLARLVGFTKEVKSRKLVSSAAGEHWVDTVELVPVTHRMEANMQVWSETLKRQKGGDVSTLLIDI